MLINIPRQPKLVSGEFEWDKNFSAHKDENADIEMPSRIMPYGCSICSIAGGGNYSREEKCIHVQNDWCPIPMGNIAYIQI